MTKRSTPIPGLSFSWKRALGITQAKQKIARETGIPHLKGWAGTENRECNLENAIWEEVTRHLRKRKDGSSVTRKDCHRLCATQGTDTCSGKKYHDLSLLSFFFVSLQMQTACCDFSVTQYDTYLM